MPASDAPEAATCSIKGCRVPPFHGSYCEDHRLIRGEEWLALPLCTHHHEVEGEAGYPCYNRGRFDGWCGLHDPRKQAERSERRGPNQAERRAEKLRALQELIAAARGVTGTWGGWNFQRLRDALKHFNDEGPLG